MQNDNNSTDPEGLSSPKLSVKQRSFPQPPMATKPIKRNDENNFLQLSASGSVLTGDSVIASPHSSTESTLSTPRKAVTPITPRTPKSTPSSRSSPTSAVGTPHRRSSKGITEEKTRCLSRSSTSRTSSRLGGSHSSPINSSEGFTFRSSSQQPQLLQSERKRPASSLPPSKRRKSNEHDVQRASQSAIVEYRQMQAPRQLTRSSSLRSPYLYESANSLEFPKLDKRGTLSIKLSVQGRDVWGKQQTEDFALVLDVNQIERSLEIHDKMLKGALLDDVNRTFNSREVDMYRLADFPGHYLPSAFAALCSVVSKLRNRNDQLVHDVEVLEDKIDYLEAGPPTPDSLGDDEDNDMVQRLLSTIQNLKTEIALLKLTQHDIPHSPEQKTAQDQEKLNRTYRDGFLRLLPTIEPAQSNSRRLSIVLNECREEERDRYDRRLDLVRQGIFQRQQKLDALTSKHEEDLSELQDQLRFQQDERNSLLQHIKYLEDKHDDHHVMLQSVARQGEHIQHKYDALDLEYSKVKKQRDVAVNVSRQVNKDLKGLLLQQTQSQIKLQRLFEQPRIRTARTLRHLEVVVPKSPSSSNLRQWDRPQELPSTPQSVARPPGRKPRPAPVMLGTSSKPLPDLERIQRSEPDSSRVSSMLNPIDIIEGIPPESPGLAIWRNALKDSQSYGPPGLTPLFESEAFRKWQFQFGQLAKVLFDITSMDQNRQIYTFTQDETLYVYPGVGDFWPVQRFDSDPASDQVFALPRTAIVLICEHSLPYRDLYRITEKWMPDQLKYPFVALEYTEQIFSTVQCAHIEVFEIDGELEEFGCLLLHNGERGYAPLYHLEPVASSRSKRTFLQCPCSDSKPYTRYGVVLKDCVSELGGVAFQQGDAIQIAHANSTGEYCVRLKRTGDTGFIYAANARIYDDISEILWDRFAARTKSEMPMLDKAVEVALPSPKTKKEIWNNNLLGNNPQHHRQSQLETNRDRRYDNWIEGPPEGNYFVETADFRKLPRVWKDVLTINPPDLGKGFNRARARSMISRENLSKYHLKRGLHIGLQPKVTRADGEIVFTLSDGAEEDRGYMSEPVTQEKRSRRAHFVFKSGKLPLDVDKYKAAEDAAVTSHLIEERDGKLVKVHPQLFCNFGHRRPGFLTQAGLRALENHIVRKGVHDSDATAISNLLKWQNIGDAVAYRLRPTSITKSKFGFEETDLITIQQILLSEDSQQPGVLAIHRDKHGRRKDDAHIFTRVSEIGHEDPRIPVRSIRTAQSGPNLANAILLGTIEENQDWRCVFMGDGTVAHRNQLRILRFSSDPIPFDYVPLQDVLHVIQDAEERSRLGEHPEDSLPEVNDTVRRIYDFFYEPGNADKEPIRTDQRQQSEQETTPIEDEHHQTEVKLRQLEQVNAALSAEKSALEHYKAEIVRENAELKQQQALAQQENAILIRELEAEKQARLELEKLRTQDGIAWEYRMIGKETEAQVPEIRSKLMGDFVNTYFRHNASPEQILMISDLMRIYATLMNPATTPETGN